jgi:hypothetical protein
VVLKVIGGSLIPFVYRAVTFYGGPSQHPSTKDQIVNSPGPERRPPLSLTTLTSQRPSLWHDMSLGFSPFARHYSGNDLFSSGY